MLCRQVGSTPQQQQRQPCQRCRVQASAHCTAPNAQQQRQWRCLASNTTIIQICWRKRCGCERHHIQCAGEEDGIQLDQLTRTISRSSSSSCCCNVVVVVA
jgi:hypothetical protein